MIQPTVYSAALCPVDGDDSVFFVKSCDTGTVFFYCPLCGIAWNYPPPPTVLDEMDPLEHFAPSGIALPTPEEIDVAGLGHLILMNFQYGEGATDFLGPHLRAEQ